MSPEPLPRGMRVSCPTLDIPLLGPAPDRWDLRYVWFWRPVALISREPQRLWGSEIILSRGSHINLLILGSNSKAVVWKWLDYIGKILFANLKASTGGEDSSWDFLGLPRCRHVPFLHSPFTLQAQTHTGKRSLTKATGVPCPSVLPWPH